MVILRGLLVGACAILATLFVGGAHASLRAGVDPRALLRSAAHELVPPGGRIRALGYGDCVELARSPSCAGVVFELPQRSSAARARAVRAVARRKGWTVARMDDAEGGWALFLIRGKLRANVFLWRPEVYGLECRSAQPDEKCFNSAAIQLSS